MKKKPLCEPEKRTLRRTPLGELYEYRIRGDITRKKSGVTTVAGDYSIRYPHIESCDSRVVAFNRFCKKVASNYAFFAINRMKTGNDERYTAILVFHLEFLSDCLFVSIRGYNGKTSEYELTEYKRLYFSLPDLVLIRNTQKRPKTPAY